MTTTTTTTPRTYGDLLALYHAAPVWEPPTAPQAVRELDESIRRAEQFPLTDTGLAERFSIQHGDSVKYCFPWGKWLVWDDFPCRGRESAIWPRNGGDVA